MSTRLLALDCATETLYLALTVGDRVLTRALAGGAQASATLLPAVQELLAEGGVTLRMLDGIAFGRGPGAFTGLRTACSVVQGLAVGADRPLIALDTLALLAESAFLQGAPSALWTVLDARMGEVYAAAWQRQTEQPEVPSEWTCTSAPALYRPHDLPTHDPTGAVLAWAGTGVHVLPALQGTGLATWPHAVPEGRALAALARAALARGRLLDAAQGLPLYVRDKVALTTQERQSAKGA